MEDKEFNLSERIKEYGAYEELGEDFNCVHTKDIKEFINKLKEGVCCEQTYPDDCDCGNCKFIDKLAGEKFK